ncbi:MAG: methyltransferase domain-containing protein [Deltaproteobacteria bacterium]|nr:methyltransferase domain-containing protein [Deltaproteobacteria bacterium]
MSEFILGISAYYHDSAAALLRDGEIIAAAQEERFTRNKFDLSFPAHAVRYVLKEGGIGLDDLITTTFYDKPYLKFDRLLETYHSLAPQGLKSYLSAMPIWIKEKIFMRNLLKKELNKIEPCTPKITFSEHHVSHAASAFYPSPFDEAAILTIDGVGEWATATIGRGEGSKIKILRQLDFPHSLGLLYSAFTYYCGFKVNSGEYKLMGLAPYGNPNSTQTKEFKRKILTELMDLNEDGSLLINLKYFDFATGLKMCRDEAWSSLFNIPRRCEESKITQPYMNLALAAQQVTEEAVLRLTQTAKSLTGCRYLVMAGGVALNCVANGKLIRKNLFEDLWIQPAAGDAGGALGAAFASWHIWRGHERRKKTKGDMMQGSYLGGQYGEADIARVAEKYRASYRRYDNFDHLCEDVARSIAEGKIVGWFQGRMEWGPRALGNRSVLGDPRHPDMQKRLNLKIKYREGFRPFAPAVLAEDADKHFDIDRQSPYMLLVAPVKKELRNPLPDNMEELSLFDKLYHQRSSIPAVTHVDFSARIQTVHRETNKKFWQLLNAFKKETGIGMLINTSFNVRGEPIVCTPEDAYRCFMHTEMDYLVMENHLFYKKDLLHCPNDKNIDQLQKYLDLLCCPKCSNALSVKNGTLSCTNCGVDYEISHNIPLLFCPNDTDELKNDITTTIKSFYEETPFPNYDDFDDVSSLIMKSRQSIFAKLLDEQIPFESRILECGCGTGQLTNFLSIAYRTVFGTDMALNSLQLGQEFKETHQLERAHFFQMNLFRPCFKPESFDLVICNGVLHHTSDPFLGLQRIARLVRPGGYIIIGLYHKYGRLVTDVRRLLFNLTKDRLLFLDRKNVDPNSSVVKREAWFKDQYKNPHESKHTIGQALGWLDRVGFKFIRSIPKSKPLESFSASEKLFEPDTAGNYWERILTEIGMIPSGTREGGFFIVIGKKKHSQN